MSPEVVSGKPVELGNALRIYLDTEWTVQELAAYFQALSNFYSIEVHAHVFDTYKPALKRHAAIRNSSFLALVNLASEGDSNNFKQAGLPNAPFEDAPAQAIVLQNFPLVSIKIRIESPGVHDIAGFADALRHLKELIIHYLPNRKARLEGDRLALENEHRREDLLQKRIATLQAAGLSKKQVQAITLQYTGSIGTLGRFAAQGKITDVRNIGS